MNIKSCLFSSLEKVYTADALPDCGLADFSMLKGERKSFQLAVESDAAFIGKISVAAELENVAVYSVNYIPSALPMYPGEFCDNYRRISDDGLYPDLLIPVDTDCVSFTEGKNIFWIEISSNASGLYPVKISVTADGAFAENSVNVEVINAALDFGDFTYTNWFHTDCLMSHYKIEVFTDEYWRIVENFLKTAVDHGMNCVLTPIFTPALDTQVGGERPTVQLVDVTVTNGKYSFAFDKLTRWMDMATRLGVKSFEMAHFFSQWGAKCAPKIMATVDGEYKRIFGWETAATSAEYTEFLTEFAAAFKPYLEKNGLKDRTLLHVSDEPNAEMIEDYSYASHLIQRLFEGYKIIDALSDIRFYDEKLVLNPIPANNHIAPFLGKVKDLWTYYCCGQTNNCVSNRFFCYSSLRNRVLGYQLYKYSIAGFLQWGYNFYYSQLSIREIDPFTVSDGGGAYPSGDSYVVYPAPDGTAYASLRFKVFYDGLQDMAALNTLERLVGKEKAMAILDPDGTLTFENYPHSENWLLDTREARNKAIKENIG